MISQLVQKPGGRRDMILHCLLREDFQKEWYGDKNKMRREGKGMGREIPRQRERETNERREQVEEKYQMENQLKEPVIYSSIET